MVKRELVCDAIQVMSTLEIGKPVVIQVHKNMENFTLRTSTVQDYCFKTTGYLEIRTKNTIYVTLDGVVTDIK